VRAGDLAQWKDAGYRDTLAAAYAEMGEFELATDWQEKAIGMASSATHKETYRQRLALYQARKPFRVDTKKVATPD
jgi:hypothetical protein